ncbi:MAG: oxidoreductase [Paenibacillus sp.]|nr:oxidoreductase [Paenibacillus sp.]
MIRFGVIGTNWITEQFIKSGLEAEGFALTAVYSRTEERAQEFAEKFNIVNRFSDLEQFAASDSFDAVYIASPNSFHAEQAIVCMNQGKHVLCEKPVASNAREFGDMIEAAQRNQVLLMEAMKTTFYPNFKAIQEHLHKIGPIRRYFATYCQYSSRYDAYKQGNVLNAFKPNFSNGSLMDLGIYCVYPMVVLFGKPDAVKANGFMLESGVDGEGSILARYGEMEGVILHSKITHSNMPSEIQGEYGNLIVDKINMPEKVEIRYRDGTFEEITQIQTPNNMVYEIKEFIGLLQQGKLESIVNSHAHSLGVMEIMDEARRQMGLVFPADSR